MAKVQIERWARPNKRSWRQDERILKANVLPVIGRCRARDITRQDITHILDGIARRGAPVMANRILTLVKKLFSWAHRRNEAIKPIVFSNP